ncbi:MAG: type II secretion system F family protein [Eggerthellaceae bacterium]|nr:type II secretion system F family protein [Eggerthellaceae bacterium]
MANVSVFPSVLVAGSCVFAAVSGFFLAHGWMTKRRTYQYRRLARKGHLSADDGHGQSATSHSFAAWLIEFMQMRSRIAALKPRRSIFRQRFWTLGAKGFDKTIVFSGLSQTISKAGFFDARGWLCLVGAGFGALVGAIFSKEMTVLLGCVMALVGWNAPLWALRQERDARKSDMENHLSEMLEVLALGLRSGLSFDAAFELYHVHFSHALGKSSLSAQQLWQMGLVTRQDALRRLAATYDSQIFSRVIENIIRSLRFGSSLAANLEASALESRTVNKALREEMIAKAPVKMLIPTAALILPAMLLLVLGPILLEMMQGF